MMFANRIVALGGRNKIAGNQSRALVNELIKCVLPIRAGFAPNDGTRFVIDMVAVSVHGFAVAFHVCLLKISGETMQILVVGQNGFGSGIEEIDVPNAN